MEDEDVTPEDFDLEYIAQLTDRDRNLTEDERNYLGAANLDAFFSHLNFLVDNPEEVKKIPNGSTVIYQETGDDWADKQNDNLAGRAIANGAEVVRITAPEKIFSNFS
jgi:hypothetical protein